MNDFLFDIDEDLSSREERKSSNSENHIPLAAKLRPRSFDEFFGQEHLVSDGKLFRKAVESDIFSSIILYGPPGVGKTSLAEIIANKTNSVFIKLSGVISKVTDLRKEISLAIERKGYSGRKTIVFIDEIHRFNRAQQDSLLPDIENGNIRFIGATTQNPYFFIVSPLLSRSLVFNLKPLSEGDIKKLVQNSISREECFQKRVVIDSDAVDFISKVCEGDARRALNLLELSAMLSVKAPNEEIINISEMNVKEAIPKKSVNYGKDEHYDTISAFIKSMRGSDVNAALYWLAKMLNAGEDIMFIARRIVIFASEDIGNSDPRAIQLATSIMQAVEMIGLPEAKILLSQAVTYCSTAPKSNASYVAINMAINDIENNRIEPVPIYLKSKYCPSSDEKKSEDYKYSHDSVDHFSGQSYLGVDKEFYFPREIGFESKILERMNYWKQFKSRIKDE